MKILQTANEESPLVECSGYPWLKQSTCENSEPSHGVWSCLKALLGRMLCDHPHSWQMVLVRMAICIAVDEESIRVFVLGPLSWVRAFAGLSGSEHSKPTFLSRGQVPW